VKKDTFQTLSAGLSLGGMLIYNFKHTGDLLALYVSPPAIGYVGAAAVELAVVSLSLRIAQKRRAGNSTAWQWAVLGAVATISSLANVAVGFYARYGVHISVATVTTVDILQAIIGICATGVMSLVTLAITEVIGVEAEAAERKAERKTGITVQPVPQKPQVTATTPEITATPVTESVTPPQVPQRLSQAEMQALLAAWEADGRVYTLAEAKTATGYGLSQLSQVRATLRRKNGNQIEEARMQL
jgi:hypothetical protein